LEEEEDYSEPKERELIKTMGRDITEIVIYIIVSAVLFGIYFVLCREVPTISSKWILPKLTGIYNILFFGIAVLIFFWISFHYGNKQKGLFKILDIIIMMLILWVMYVICLIPVTMDMGKVITYAVEIIWNTTVWLFVLTCILPGRIISLIYGLFRKS